MNYPKITIPSTTNLVEIILEDKDGNVVKRHSQENAYTYKAWEYFFNAKSGGWGNYGGIVTTTNRDVDNTYDILYERLWVSSDIGGGLDFMTTTIPTPNISSSGGKIEAEIGYVYNGSPHIRNTRTYGFQHGGVDMTVRTLGLGTTTCHSYIKLTSPIEVTREHRLIVKYHTMFKDDDVIDISDGSVKYKDNNRVSIGRGEIEMDNGTFPFEVFVSKYRTEYNKTIVSQSHGNRRYNTSLPYKGQIIDTEGKSTSLSGQWNNITTTISDNKRNYTYGSRYVIPPTHPKIVNAKTIFFDYQMGGNKFEVVFDTPLNTNGDVQITFDFVYTLVANQEK